MVKVSSHKFGCKYVAAEYNALLKILTLMNLKLKILILTSLQLKNIYHKIFKHMIVIFQLTRICVILMMLAALLLTTVMIQVRIQDSMWSEMEKRGSLLLSARTMCSNSSNLH